MSFGGQLNQVMQNEKTSGHINIQLMFYKYFSSMNIKLLKPYLFMGMSLFFSGWLWIACINNFKLIIYWQKETILETGI